MKIENTLTVIVPFFNEFLYLEESIQRLIKNDIYKKIILVDDCSNDGSELIGKKISESNKKIIYLKTKDNLGKGNAINCALEFVESTHVVIHDADLEYFPEDIIAMQNLLLENNNSLILGSRFIGNKTRKNIYFRTYLANRIMSVFFSLINFYYVSDVATCYKLMPTKFFKSIVIKENGFSIEIEILSKFLKYNKSIVEVPIKYEGRTYKQGKKIKTVDGFKYLYKTVKYRIAN